MMADTFWAPANDERYELLERAAQGGDEELLDQAIRSNARLDAYFGHESSNDGRTALHTAAFNGHLPIVRTLLARGVDVNITDRDDLGETTPLYYAAESAKPDVVKYLLAAGAHTADVFGPTDDTLLSVVLHQPQRSDEARLQTLAELLDHGVDVDVKYTPDGATVLDHAVIQENIRIIHFLRDRGASFADALTTAVQHNKIPLFPVLLDAGATDKKSSALSAASRAGKLDMIGVLLQRAPGSISPAVSSGPVCAAVAGGHLRAVETLLDSGFALNEPDHLGLRPLHHAVRGVSCSYDMVQLLLDRGADPLALSVQGSKPWFSPGMSALHVAAESCVLPVVEKMVAVAPSLLHQRVGAGRYPGDTPLLTFVRTIAQNVSRPTTRSGAAHARVRALSILADAGADVNTTDHQGRTCLHILAAANCNTSDDTILDAIGVLLDRGADRMAKDNDGVVAYQIASNDTVVSLLSASS